MASIINVLLVFASIGVDAWAGARWVSGAGRLAGRSVVASSNKSGKEVSVEVRALWDVFVHSVTTHSKYKIL